MQLLHFGPPRRSLGDANITAQILEQLDHAAGLLDQAVIHLTASVDHHSPSAANTRAAAATHAEAAVVALERSLTFHEAAIVSGTTTAAVHLTRSTISMLRAPGCVGTRHLASTALALLGDAREATHLAHRDLKEEQLARVS